MSRSSCRQEPFALNSPTQVTALKTSMPIRVGKPSELSANFPGIVDKILGQISGFFDDLGSGPHLILYLEDPVYYVVEDYLYRSAPERQ